MRIAVVAPDQELPHYEQAAKRSQLFELVRFVGDLSSPNGIDELLQNRDEFDAVTMLSPNSISREQIESLATNGKHVLINAQHTTPEFLDEMSARWHAANAHFAVAQPRRFTDYATAIQDGLKGQQLGTPGLLRIHHWLEPDDSEMAQPQKTLWQTTIEEIDLACGLFAARPHFVFSQNITFDNNDPQQTLGGVLIHLGFEKGGMALIDVAFHQASSFYTATLIGASGAAYADDHHNTNLLLRGQTQGIRVADNTAPSSWLRPQIESFVNAIERGEPDNSIGSMQLAILVSQTAMQCCGSNQAAKWTGNSYELQ